jgi:hypothetical protein
MVIARTSAAGDSHGVAAPPPPPAPGRAPPAEYPTPRSISASRPSTEAFGAPGTGVVKAAKKSRAPLPPLVTPPTPGP